MATLAETARKIFFEALADCDVDKAMKRCARVNDGALHCDSGPVDLTRLKQLRIVAAGKAGNSMLRGLWEQLPAPPGCEIAGVLIAPERPDWLPREFQYFQGGHPAPNEASFAGARAALRLAAEAATAGENALCLFLISGGASAMMEVPLDASISLAETVEFHRALVGSGAKITEINCVRKHFSEVKGGRLAVAAGTAQRRTFLLSDVPPGREDSLGSGPTVPDSSTVGECKEILDRYQLKLQFPAAATAFFESNRLVETPKPGELASEASVVLSSDDLAKAAARHAERLGMHAVIDNTCDDWEYREAAKYLLSRLHELGKQHRRVCLISAGEVGVVLPPKEQTGVGGRNQQFALYAATLLKRDEPPAAVLSAGSDGIDGNSQAAGAVVDEQTLSSTNELSDAGQALANFDAYSFFAARNAAIVSGPTGNNLRDLRILVAAGD